MYNVYDFINNDISEKQMRFGWKIEIDNAGLSCHNIVLKYTMLNFDWQSLKFINCELWNMFLSSYSYTNMKKKIDNASKKFNRTYFEAINIEHLKCLMENENLKINLDKLIESTVKKKSKKVKEKIENKKISV